MPINQPIITGNQADDSWKLEATNQLNNEEVRVNALTTQVNNIQTTVDAPNEFIMNISLGFLLQTTTTSSAFPLPFNAELTDWAVWFGAVPATNIEFEVVRNSNTNTGSILTATNLLGINSVLQATRLNLEFSQFDTVNLVARGQSAATRAAGTLLFRRI